MREERIAIRLECLKLACTKAIELGGIISTAEKFEEHVFRDLPEPQKGDSNQNSGSKPRPSSKSGTA